MPNSEQLTIQIADEAQSVRTTRSLSIVATIGSTVGLMYYLALAVYLDEWRFLVAAGATVALLAGMVTALLLTYRHQWRRAFWVMVITGSITFLVPTAVFQDVSLMQGPAIVLLIVLATLQTLPRGRERSLAIYTAMASAVLNLLIDQFWPVPRPIMPTAMVLGIGAIILLAALAFLFYFFRNFAAMDLRAKTTALIATLAIVTVALTATATIVPTRATLLQNARDTLHTMAGRTAATLDDLLAGGLASIQAEAQNPVLSELLTISPQSSDEYEHEQEEALRTLLAFKAKDPVFISSYALLDASGRVVLSTEKSEIGRDESNRDYFQKTYQSGLPSLSVWYSEKSLYFSAPVRNENEAVVGVLRARYDAAFLQQLITQHSGLGAQEAYAVLLDEHHIILAHSLYPQTIFKSLVPLDTTLLQQWQAEGRFPSGEPTMLSINLPEVEEKLAQIREEPFFEVTDVQGIRQQAAAATMKERPWTVVFIQPRSVFITPINQQIRRSILMAIGVIFLAAYASLGLSRLITTPLSQLTESARRIAAGELDIQAEVTSRDEIGALAQAFNEMTSQLRDMIASLEERVAERTRDLEERSAYLQAAAEIGRAVAATLDPESLVQQAVDLMKERFGLYYVGLFELDGTGEWANLRAGTGKEGQAMIARRHRIRVGSGMIGWCIANRQPRIAQQAELDDVRLRPPELPKTRAEAALPLRARGEVLGALTIQSDQPGFFTPDNLAIFQIIADQIAVALENARLFAESQAALSSLERITLERARRGWQERLLRAGQAIAVRADGHSTLPAPPVLDENVRRALERGEITAEVDEQTPGGNYLLNVPIKVRGTTIGVLRTYKPAERGAWTEAEVQALSAIAERLALSIESARLFEETVRRAEREHLVTEITTRIRSTTDPQEMIRIAIEELKQALGVSHVRITPQRLSPAITETPSSDGNSPQE